MSRQRAPIWQLRVYVANWKTRSALTVANLERICDQSVPGHYRIQIVDLLKHPERCQKDGILALPTVVRYFPGPERRVIGTLSDTQAAIAALELDAMK
ncbi:MAG TPA: circadian clock KaiB family protein [Bryobacteraceae bacterium]